MAGFDFSQVDKVVNTPTAMRVGTEFAPPKSDESGFIQFGEKWFPGIVNLGKDITNLAPEVRDARIQVKKLRSIGDERSLRLADRIEKTQLPPKPTPERVIADTAETAMYAYMPTIFKSLKALPALRAMATGAVVGGAFGTTTAMRKNKSFEDVLASATMGAGIGSALGIGSHLILSKGMFKMIPMLSEKIIPEETRKMLRQKIYPVLDILSSDFGETGKKIAKLWKLTRADAGVIAGEPTLRAFKAGIMTKKFKRYNPLTDEDAWLGDNSLYDVLTGRGDIKTASPEVQKAANVARSIYNTYAGLGEEEGIFIGKRQNYMNQLTPNAAGVISSKETLARLAAAKTGAEREAILLSNEYKRPYLLNAVNKLHKFDSIEQANNVLESWGKWVLDGGRYSKRSEKFISWLMNSEKATTLEEAQVLAKDAFSNLTKPALEPISGFLEKHRKIDFPFFNPDPRVALPAYILDVSGRLAYLKHFGQGGVAKLLQGIEATQGPQQAVKAEKLVRTILNTTKRDAMQSGEKAIASFLKGIQTPKLSFSAITNLGQSLNSLLGSDLRSVAYGLKVAFTNKGFEESLKSGATLQSVMHRVLGYAGGGTRFGDAILKYSGFSWTELFNRTVAANTGGHYFEKVSKLLAKFPDNPRLRAMVEELGGNASEIIARKGNVLVSEKLRAMNIFSAKTQFLNDAASLPQFASSPWGQVLFQFKNYAYNQTRFVAKELGTQWAQKNYGRLVRDVAILGLVFPVYGEISSDIRSTLTGSKRPTTYLNRWISDIANAGSFGIAFDLWQSASFGRVAESVFGPTVGMTTGFMENFAQSVNQKSINPELKFILNQTGVGRIVTGHAMPSGKRKGYGQWWEFYDNMGK